MTWPNWFRRKKGPGMPAVSRPAARLRLFRWVRQRVGGMENAVFCVRAELANAIQVEQELQPQLKRRKNLLGVARAAFRRWRKPAAEDSPRLLAKS